VTAPRLATILAECWPDAPLDESIEPTVEAMLARGRDGWPGIVVGAAEYVRFVCARAPGGQLHRLSELHASDLYLTCACACGDEQAIASLDRDFLRGLVPALSRGGVKRENAEEAVQSLRERLFVATGRPAKITEYSGRGALGGWLRVAATRLALNLRRDEAARTAVSAAAAPPSPLPLLDPEIAMIQRRYGEAFNLAFHDAFGSLTAEQRSVLRLHFVDGLNLERIAIALGLSRATIGRRMIGARERLLDEVLRRLGERLHATPTELASLLAVVRSKLDVSLGALVGKEPS
jgi:RNA polymerase sigma-70 factor (ECF subfamily)